MDTKIQRRGEANVPLLKNDFAGKAQMSKVLCGVLTML
jgi:hypothetical protein